MSVANFLLPFLGLGLGIAAFVFALLWALSAIGGWGALARSYACAPETVKGALLEEKRQRKAWVGLLRYGTLVTARSYERGLELASSAPFSTPLFFPWEEIRDYKRVSLFPWMVEQFTVGGLQVRLTDPLEELGRRRG